MLCVFSEWICMKGRNALPWYSWLGIIMTVAAATSLAGVFTHTLSCTDTVIVANCYTLYCHAELLKWHYCAGFLVPPGPH